MSIRNKFIKNIEKIKSITDWEDVVVKDFQLVSNLKTTKNTIQTKEKIVEIFKSAFDEINTWIEEIERVDYLKIQVDDNSLFLSYDHPSAIDEGLGINFSYSIDFSEKEVFEVQIYAYKHNIKLGQKYSYNIDITKDDIIDDIVTSLTKYVNCIKF